MDFGGEDKQLVFDVSEKWELKDWYKNQEDIKKTALFLFMLCLNGCKQNGFTVSKSRITKANTAW